MKKKLITIVLCAVCTCSILVACGKKPEVTESVPDEPATVSEVVADAPAEVTPASNTPVAAGEVSVAELTGVDVSTMTDEQSEFYQILCRLAEQSYEIKATLNSGITAEEVFGVTEEEYIKWASEEATSSISNAERRQKATEVFINHFWELADNYDYNNGSYPDWETLYNEYSGGSSGSGFTSSVTDADTMSEAFASSVLKDNTIYSKDGVEFTVDKISTNNIDFKVTNNNSNNKKVRFIVWDITVNGLSVGAQWDSSQVLVGDTVSYPCDIYTYRLVDIWNAYGVSLSDAPIETIGIYYSVQIGSDSEFEYAYAELKTNNYSTGDKLFGTKLGSIDFNYYEADKEISVTTTVYRYDAVDGIVISMIGNYPVMDGAYNNLMIGNKNIQPDNYVYGGGGTVVWIKLSDEETLRREFELGPDEPMNFRYEIDNDSVTIIE